MVKNIPFLPRDSYPSREQWPTHDRYMNDSSINPTHFSTLSSARSPAPTQVTAIETALRERCGISVKDFAMIATLEDGTTATFTSEKLMAHEKYLFSQQFKEVYFRQTDDVGSGNLPAGHYGFPASANYGDFGNINTSLRRQSGSTDSSNEVRRRRNRYRDESIAEDSEDDTVTPSKSRRKRHRGAQDTDDEKPPSMAQNVRYRNLVIGNKVEVTKYLQGRFRDMQQASCKMIAKAFIRVVEPRKQTNHPYTGGNDHAPDWWPDLPTAHKPGTGVKHKEPDHLLKPERIELLIHLLRLGHMTGKNNEMNHVTVKELQVKAKEALVTWVSEKPGNKAKMKYLDEIFKVARAEERFCNGEIDASYTIPVMHGADLVVPDPSEDEQGDDGVKDEDEQTFTGMSPQSQQICTPESMVSPTSTHSHGSLNRPLSSNTMSGFGNYSREMPVRQYQQASPHTGLPPPNEQPSYENESLSMGVQNFLPPRMTDLQQHQNHGLPDNSRRQTWHQPNGFSNPSNMFPNWSSNNAMMPASSVQYSSFPAPSSTPLASNGPLLPLPNTSAALLPPMHHNTTQQSTASNFHDPTSPPMTFRDQNNVAPTSNSLRTGSLSNPHHQYHAQQNTPHPTYMNEYLNDYSTHSGSVMKDENIGGGG